MSSPETAFEWFVIYCENDDSHTLVDETRVICNDSVREGDTVRFSYPGVKDLLDGVVKAISRDKNKMIKEQDRLNKLTKPRRETSFHADRPRKAALLAKVLGGVCTKAVPKESNSRRGVSQSEDSSCSSRAGECSPQDGQQKPLSALMQDVSSDSDDSLSSKNIPDSVTKTEDYIYSDKENDVLETVDTVPIERHSLSSSSSGSDMELTPAEEELLKKLTKKSRKRDNKDLSQLVSLREKPRTVMEEKGDQEENVKDSVKDKSTRKSGDKEESKNSEVEVKDGSRLSADKRKETGGMDRMDKRKDERNGGMERIDKKMDEKNGCMKRMDKKTDEKNGDMERGRKEKDEKNRRKEIMDKDSNEPSMKMEFNGNFYRTSETTTNAIAFPSTKVYITEKQLKDVKRRGHTATATARMLLSYIHTDEAMAACSASGVARVSKATKQVSQRPALHQEGVEAIIDFVSSRASKKGWPCPQDSAIRQCLNNKLCEQRAEAEAREERRNQLQKKSE